MANSLLGLHKWKIVCSVLLGKARNLLTKKLYNINGILLTSYSIEEGRSASKCSHETFGYFISLPSKKFLPITSKSRWRKLLPKTEGTKTKAARCLFFLMSFPFLYILNALHLLLLFTFCQFCLLDCRD